MSDREPDDDTVASREAALDEALEMTFPASDPLASAPALPATPGHGSCVTRLDSEGVAKG